VLGLLSREISVISNRIAVHAVGVSVAALLLGIGSPITAHAADDPAVEQSAAAPPADAPAAPVQHFDIYEYRVEGTHLLSEAEVEAAVYPYLGPNLTQADAEKARAALEKAYNAKGYQTVAVEIPQQQVKDGVVVLQVVEGKIGRLRVKGSRYFSLDQIKKQAPSLAEGTVPNFNDVKNDIVALNQIPDRQVTPTLRAGVTPGTVDVDLNVKDTLPLHGGLELNNRYSADTTELRLNANLRYDNLWQRGDSISFGYQIAPQNTADAEVYSASYLARIPDINWLSMLVYGVKQDSDVNSLGSVDVAGRGQIVGLRAVMTLPSEQDFFESLSAGFDYKHFDEGVSLGGDELQTPITYFPITATYSATWSGKDWQGKDALTQLNIGTTFHFEGLGSNPEEFDAKRFQARGDFIYLRGDLSRTQELPWFGLQLFGKVQGQLSNEPLVSSEQFSAGGLDTVRGYLESEVLGDNAIIGSLELRSPSLADWVNKRLHNDTLIDEWRVYVFSEGGTLAIDQPLPEQDAHFDMASVGFGSRIRLIDYPNGSLDFGVPLISQTSTSAFNPRLTFRVWGEF